MNFNLSLFLFLTLTFFQINPLLAQKEHSCSKLKSKFSPKNSSRSLVSEEHKNLMKKYDVKSYFLDVNLERNSTYLSGMVEITAEALSSSLDSIAFELHENLIIDSLFINNIFHPGILRSNGGVIVPCLNPILLNELVFIKIYYKGNPPAGGGAAIGNGISTGTSGSWGNQVTWTLSQPFAAYEWWPCKQALEDKADSSKVYITTSNENKAGSNGILQNIVNLPNNKVQYQWINKHPINYYLISISVAKYVEYTIYANPVGSPNPIKIQNYVYDNPNTLPYFKSEIDATADMMELFSSLYGLYPFHEQKYGHCMAPFSGGMEHQTMTTQGWFEFSLIAHELGHQWFGDNVTCQSWNDIWLNEGFASYSEFLAYEALKPSEMKQWMTDNHNSVLSQNGGSVYVNDETDVSRIFSSRLTYDKGAAIIHTLRFELANDSLFFEILKSYQNSFKNSTANTNDFKSIVEYNSGKNFSTFFDQWYYGEGFPIFSMNWNHLNDTLYLKVNQSVSSPSITPLFKTSLEIKIQMATSDSTIKINIDLNTVDLAIPFTGNPTQLLIDPNNWILNKTGIIQKDANLGTEIKSLTKYNVLKISPNPTPNNLRILSENSDNLKSLSYKITDFLGNRILEGEMHSDHILTESLAGGLYFITIHSGKETLLREKFIKK